MGDAKKLKTMDRRNACLHESAHSVVRQLTIGNLGEVGVERRGPSYAYPVERKPFGEMSREELAKVAVVVAAGIYAEEKLCSKVGNQNHAVADDMRQWEAIRQLGGYSDEEMQAFFDEAAELIHRHEHVIRKMALELDRRKKMTGERVSRLIEKHQGGKTE